MLRVAYYSRRSTSSKTPLHHRQETIECHRGFYYTYDFTWYSAGHVCESIKQYDINTDQTCKEIISRHNKYLGDAKELKQTEDEAEAVGQKDDETPY